MRFMTALGVGGEWAAGAALVARSFPRARAPWPLGLLQALSAIGNMLASVITLVIAQVATDAHQASSWRWAYFVGAAPALLVFWIQSSVKEPEKWQEAKRQASFLPERAGQHHPPLHASGFASQHHRRRPHGHRRRLCSLGRRIFQRRFRPRRTPRRRPGTEGIDTRVSIMFFCQQVGAFIGIYLFAVFRRALQPQGSLLLLVRPRLGQCHDLLLGELSIRPGARLSGECCFAPILGFGTLGPFSGYTVYFPSSSPPASRAHRLRILLQRRQNSRRRRTLRPLAGCPPTSSSPAVSPPPPASVTCIYFIGIVGTLLAPETKGKPLPEDADFESPLARPVVSDCPTRVKVQFIK